MTARLRWEQPAAGVARIVLTRADRSNAQDPEMLYELNDAFDRAARDDAIRVVIIAADGENFSSGHDLDADWQRGDRPPVSCWSGFGQPGVEGTWAMEEELFLGLSWRWRNHPKVTVAQVQGWCVAGGLMLVWPCDLIVAADDARFSDPVVAFGVNGNEYFLHAWELGARLAKEMLFTGRALSAAECERRGMVNAVVPRADLEDAVLKLARRIADRPAIGLKLAKQAVNQSLDAQGQWTAVQAAMSLHQMGHAHNQQVHGQLVDPAGFSSIRKAHAEAE